MTPRKLHIGGRVRKDGWEVLNTVAGPHVDHICNANDMSSFTDSCFDEIYASHVVEHLDYKDELSATLSSWHRVLRPGGKLYVSVPDLDILAALVTDKAGLTIQDRYQVMRMIFGGHMDEYDYHVTGLNEDFLTIFLKEAGFNNISKVENFGLFEDTSSFKFKGTPISLNLVARKPMLSNPDTRQTGTPA